MNFIQITIVSLALLPSVDPKKKATIDSTQKQNLSVQPCPILPPLSTLTSDQSNAKQGQDHNESQAVRITRIDRDRWDWIAYISSLVLAAVGVTGGYIGLTSLQVVRRQAIEMGRQRNTMQQTLLAMIKQTEVAERSASTAQAGLDALIAKESPRLSLEISGFEFHPLPVLRYTLTCHGTTPAFISVNWVNISLNEIPDYPWPEDAFGFHLEDIGSFISPGRIEGSDYILRGEHSTMAPKQIEASLKGGSLYVHFRVRIVYSNVFGIERELIIAKVFGVAPIKPQKGSRAFYSSIYAANNPSPEWRNSVFGYGQEEDQ